MGIAGIVYVLKRSKSTLAFALRVCLSGGRNGIKHCIKRVEIGRIDEPIHAYLMERRIIERVEMDEFLTAQIICMRATTSIFI